MIHYPPYKSKYNAIERCLFAPISHVLEGRPLYHLQELLNLIRSTKTQTGLTVEAELDTGIYKTGNKISDEDLDAINIEYIGPTRDNKVHLSYIIRGTKDQRGLLPHEVRQTVFDLKEKIDTVKKEAEEQERPNTLQTSKKRKTRSDKGGKHKWRVKISTLSSDIKMKAPVATDDGHSLMCTTI